MTRPTKMVLGLQTRRISYAARHGEHLQSSLTQNLFE